MLRGLRILVFVAALCGVLVLLRHRPTASPRGADERGAERIATRAAAVPSNRSARADGGDAPPPQKAARPHRGVVVGWVMDAAELPCVASVLLLPPRSIAEDPITIETGPDGRFSVEVAEGDWYVRARRGDTLSDTERAEVEAGEEYDIGGLMLEEGTPVHGYVTDLDGRPVEGARVETFGEFGGRCDLTETDPSGAYRLLTTSLEGSVVARAAGYAPSIQAFRLEPGRQVRRDHRMARGAGIRGRVVNGRGEPVPDARIEARCHQKVDMLWDTLALEARAGPSGEYSLSDMMVCHWSVTCRSDGYATEEEYLEIRDETRVDFTLWGATMVRGRIAGAASPLDPDHTTIYLLRIDGAEREYRGSARLKGDGFEFEDVPPGRFEVVVDTLGFAVSPSRPFDVAEGAPVEGIEVALVPASCVRGVVRSRLTGKPIEGARLHLRGPGTNRVNSWDWAESNRAGAYAIRGLSVGTIEVQVLHPSHVERTVRVEVGVGQTVRLDIDLDEGEALTGRVLLDGGDPPASAGLGFCRPGGYEGHGARCAAGGEWRAQGLTPGRWVASASWDDGQRKSATRRWMVEVPPGETRLPDIVLRTTPRVHGRLTVRGERTSYMYVSFLALRLGQVTFTPEGTYEGTYDANGFEPGEYVVVPCRRVEDADAFAVGTAERFAADGWPRVTIPEGSQDVELDIDLPSEE